MDIEQEMATSDGLGGNRPFSEQVRKEIEHRDQPGITWVRQTKALREGDACEWRYPAKRGWRPGRVLSNGGGYYWRIEDTRPDDEKDERDLEMEKRKGDAIKVLYIEQIKAAGGAHYEDEEE